ncbi:putative catalytic [Hibiscus syriacus]|uniref:Catalytic n=1 Tax=Hibiscus syriacus TaxID=106335 RepID=A0A6A3CK92_HIBSY|nr:putative catalytic [Hibiscus syriacus]
MDLTSTSSRSFSNKKVTVVLDETNFLLWKQHILLTVRSHRLERLLTGDVSSLPMTVIDPNGETRVNNEYEDFVAQDIALASWLFSTMSTHLLPQFVGADTAAAVWETVLKFFANRSTMSVTSLHYKLQSIRKCNDSMRTYLTRIKKVCDALAFCGSAVPPVEQIVTILKGLPREYQPFMAVVSTMKEDLSIDNIHTMLMDAEVQIARFDEQQEILPMSANYALGDTDRSNTNRSEHRNSRAPSSGSGSRNGGRGRGRTRVQCQLCGKPCHLVDRCWHRFDEDFNCVTTNSHSLKESSSSYYSSSGSSSASNQGCECCSHIKTDSQANMATAFSKRWVVDSGATHHVTLNKANLTNATDFHGSGKITVGNDVSLDIRTVGRAALPSTSRILMLHDLLYVPHITKNLLSVSKFARDNNIFFEFHENNCCVRDEITKRVLLTGEESGGLYSFVANYTGKEDRCTAADASLATKTMTSELEKLWHRILGHPSTETLRQVTKELDVKLSFDINKTCTACQMGKNHKLPFMQSTTFYETPFQLIFTYLWGPPHISLNCFRYYASFVDACTRHTWIYLLKYKSQATKAFLLFQKMTLTQFGATIKSVQSDWGGEFRSLSPILTKAGITHRLTCPHTSEQNGIVERKHRHLVEMALALLAQGLSLTEKLLGHKPNYSELKVFGYQCFPHLRPFQTHKLAFRSQPCTYLGKSSLVKSCVQPAHSGTSGSFESGETLPFNMEGVSESLNSPTEVRTESTLVSTASGSAEGAVQESTGVAASNRDSSEINGNFELNSEIPASGVTHARENAGGRSHTNIHPMLTRGKCGIYKPKAYSSQFDEVVPSTIDEALKSPKRAAAVQEEYDALKRNRTWTLVKLPSGSDVVCCKWLFKVKQNPDGSVHRYKARLVAKGFSQVPGHDYLDTFSPVEKFTTLNVILEGLVVLADISMLQKQNMIVFSLTYSMLNASLCEDFMVQKLGIEANKVSEIKRVLCRSYGTTMVGLLALGYNFDYDEYHNFIHRRMPYEILKPDHVLRDLLLSLPIRKVIHVAEVLRKLELEDCFERVISFETLNPTNGSNPLDDEKSYKLRESVVEILDNSQSVLPETLIVCKPFKNAFEQAFRIANINPQKTIRTWFDIWEISNEDVDDTLYHLSSGLSKACTRNIEDFMVQKLGIEANKVSEINRGLYKNYGTSMAGLRDSAIASWLVSTINPHLLPQFVGVETTAVIWRTVLQFFTNRSKIALINIHYKLHSLKKGGDNMHTYLTRLVGFDEQVDLLFVSVNLTQGSIDRGSFNSSSRQDSRPNRSANGPGVRNHGMGRGRTRILGASSSSMQPQENVVTAATDRWVSLLDNVVFLEFHAKKYYVRDEATGQVLLSGEEVNDLYSFKKICAVVKGDVNIASKSFPDDELWHRRLGHPSFDTLNKIARLVDVKLSFDVNKVCSACHVGKSHKLPFSQSNTEYSSPFQLVHTDLWGPPHVASNDFRKWCTHNLEYLSRLTCPHTSEQNGKVERRHRRLVELALVILSQASMPIKFWSYVVATAVGLINKQPTKELEIVLNVKQLVNMQCDSNQSLYESLRGKSETYEESSNIHGEHDPHVGNSLDLQTSSSAHNDQHSGQPDQHSEQPNSEEERADEADITIDLETHGDTSGCGQAVIQELSEHTGLRQVQNIHPILTRSKCEWKNAVQAEVDALQRNETLSLVKLPPGRTTFGCKWIFKVKHNPDGSIHCYKARLVAKGFTQVPGHDFCDTFSPVVKFSTVNVIFTLAVSNACAVWIKASTSELALQAEGSLVGDRLSRKVAQFMHAPLVTHLAAVKRILRYLAGTVNHGLFFSPVDSRTLVSAFVDADWGANLDDRRSVSGYGVLIGKCLVAWSSKKQRSVSRSTMEAEYKSVVDVATEVTWISTLLIDLGVQQQGKEKVAIEHICVNYVPGAHQVANGLTKPMSKEAFEEF